MPSMSYCMFENTASDMNQVLEAMREASDIEELDLNEYEQEGFRDLYAYAKQYIAQYERLAGEFEGSE
jgi:hypothetical protein